MGTTTRTWTLIGVCCVALGCLALGCEGGAGPTAGGETHFLDLCDETCPDGLSCVCGVCTQACDGDAVCGALGGNPSCVGMNAYACDSDMPRFCDQTCRDDADCGGMGAGFRCAAGVCRLGGYERSMAPKEKPFVLLLVDSSGSMERRTDCTCTSLDCAECLPSCGARSERNRWAHVLEALSGSWSDEDFRCEALERTAENGATFDLNYYFPYHRPPVDVAQADDGVLDVFRTKLRFGVATFDGEASYGSSTLVELQAFDASQSFGRSGVWSYGGVRAVAYPGCETTYAIDTGIRGPQAEEGALIAGLGPGEMLKANDRIQAELLRVRPYGGTPIPAALDDLRAYLETVPTELGRSLDPARDRIVLITDGGPSQDFRDEGCDCTQNTDPNGAGYCGLSVFNDPVRMVCPYPLATEATEALRGYVQVDVIAFDADAAAVAQLEAIAAAGSDRPLARAGSAAELREVLTDRLEGLGR